MFCYVLGNHTQQNIAFPFSVIRNEVFLLLLDRPRHRLPPAPSLVEPGRSQKPARQPQSLPSLLAHLPRSPQQQQALMVVRLRKILPLPSLPNHQGQRHQQQRGRLIWLPCWLMRAGQLVVLASAPTMYGAKNNRLSL